MSHVTWIFSERPRETVVGISGYIVLMMKLIIYDKVYLNTCKYLDVFLISFIYSNHDILKGVSYFINT